MSIEPKTTLTLHLNGSIIPLTAERADLATFLSTWPGEWHLVKGEYLTPGTEQSGENPNHMCLHEIANLPENGVGTMTRNTAKFLMERIEKDRKEIAALRARAERAEQVGESKINELVKEMLKLERGCACEHDFRCAHCDQIIKTKELASKLYPPTAAPSGATTEKREVPRPDGATHYQNWGPGKEFYRVHSDDTVSFWHGSYWGPSQTNSNQLIPLASLPQPAEPAPIPAPAWAPADATHVLIDSGLVMSAHKMEGDQAFICTSHVPRWHKSSAKFLNEPDSFKPLHRAPAAPSKPMKPRPDGCPADAEWVWDELYYKRGNADVPQLWENGAWNNSGVFPTWSELENNPNTFPLEPLPTVSFGERVAAEAGKRLKNGIFGRPARTCIAEAAQAVWDGEGKK